MSKEAKKAVVDCLIKAMMNRPDDFEIGELTMKDKKTEYDYWISGSYGVYRPFTLKFGLIQGHRFGKALLDLKAYHTIQKTCGEPANAAA